MKYQYNYSFLSKWLKANKSIQKGCIQDALGAKSNNGFKSWVRGDGPMPIITMLRFCNSFQIPVTAFFRDMDADEDTTLHIAPPRMDEQLEPNGGYADLDGRHQGDRSVLNPLAVTVTPSTVPDEEPLDANCTQAKPSPIMIGRLSDTNMQAIIELETKHAEHCERLLSIIAEQQEQIADLTTRLYEVTVKSSR